MDDEKEPAADDPADALNRVTDDRPSPEAVEAERAAVAWAAGELLAGRTFEDVAADLAADGWPAEDVEAIVEQARVQTRRERGVLTRDDVVGRLNVQRRHDTRGLVVAARSSPFMIVGLASFLVSFNASVRTFRWLRHLRDRPPADDDQPPPPPPG